MSHEGANPSPMTPVSPGGGEPSAAPPAPAAWLPITFNRVASFANASGDRLLFLQLAMALIVAASLLRFIHSNYVPVIDQAIRNMPENAALQDGVLEGAPHGTLATEKFLSIVVDLDEGGLGQVGDVQLELHRRYFAVCPMFRALAGVGKLRYPPGFIPMGRADLEARWEAWRPMLYAAIVASVTQALMLLWLILATVYAFPLRLLAYFGNRSLTLGQSWKVAGAALMPGAALMEAGLVLYGAQWLDLVGLSLLTALHLLVGWIFLAMSLGRVPRIPVIEAAPNSFRAQAQDAPDGGGKAAESDNPFRS